MNIKKLLLPLTFLGLSPTAHAANTNTNQTDSVPKTQKNADFSAITFIPQHTIDFMDAQEDSLRLVSEDSITSAEMSAIHNKLIKTYNETPYKYSINDIINLLYKIENPHKFYKELHLSIPHAQYFMENITPQLQNKLHIQDKTDILITAINNRAHTLSNEEALYFAVDGKYFDKIAEPAVVLHKALQIPLNNIVKIGQQPLYKQCIQNIIDFVFANQDDTEVIKLYSDIFIATAQTIREFNEKTDTQEQYAISMNYLVPLVERYNARIKPNSVLDQEIKIKKPHDYVINQYDEIFFRINLTKIYNDAYLKYIMQSPNMKQPIYKSASANKMYLTYINAIELQTIARTKKLTLEQQTTLDSIIKQHPEIALFEPYFANVYYNTENRKEILDFMAKVKFTKNKLSTLPVKLSNILKQMQESVNKQCKLLHENLINIPKLTVTLPHKVYYSDIMNKSNLPPMTTHEHIKSALYKQYDDVSMQKQSLLRITQNNNTNTVLNQKAR